MKTNIFKYLKFLSIAAFSSAVMFTAAFGACATQVNVGGNGMTQVGSLTGVTTISSDDSSGVNLKFAKYKSLFKTLNIRKASDNVAFIDAVDNTSMSLNFQAYPAFYIAKFVQGTTLDTTGFKLGTKDDLAVRHAKMCALIDHVPAGTNPNTIANDLTPSPVPGATQKWNFYDWTKAWSGNQGIIESMLSSTDFFYSFLDTKIDTQGAHKDGYSAVIGSLAQNTGVNLWSLDYTSNNLTFVSEWSTTPEWQGLIGKGQSKKDLITFDGSNMKGALRHISHDSNPWVGAFYEPNDIFRMGDKTYANGVNAVDTAVVSMPNAELLNSYLGNTNDRPPMSHPHSLYKHKLLEVAYLLCEPKQ